VDVYNDRLQQRDRVIAAPKEGVQELIAGAGQSNNLESEIADLGLGSILSTHRARAGSSRAKAYADQKQLLIMYADLVRRYWRVWGGRMRH